MSLLKRVIKSFQKFFQITKSPIKRKSKPGRKKPQRRKPALKSKQLHKSRSTKNLVSHKKNTEKSAAKPKVTKASSNKSKVESKDHSDNKKIKEIPVKIPKGKLIGDITHYFSRIRVIVLEVKNGPLKIGDQIFIEGSKSHFTQTVRSMQIESVDVKSAKKGQIIGLQVIQDVQVGDKVYFVK